MTSARLEDLMSGLFMALFFTPALVLPGWLVQRRVRRSGRPELAWIAALSTILLFGLAPVLMEITRPLEWWHWPLFWLRPLLDPPLGPLVVVTALVAWGRASRLMHGGRIAVAFALTGLWWSWSVALFGYAL